MPAVAFDYTVHPPERCFRYGADIDTLPHPGPASAYRPNNALQTLAKPAKAYRPMNAIAPQNMIVSIEAVLLCCICAGQLCRRLVSRLQYLLDR